MRKRSRGQTDTVVGSVEDGVEALEEGKAVDEVEALARVRSKIPNDEVNVSGGAADCSVQRAGPDLGVSCQFKGSLGCRRR